ncbi:hypothetical protein B0H13DRAFT_1882302 [Mycena leptocephala]|nr:hypothetical protein B0H13DRAFT_1882302 [Mycena leptocephala]
MPPVGASCMTLPITRPGLLQLHDAGREAFSDLEATTRILDTLRACDLTISAVKTKRVKKGCEVAAAEQSQVDGSDEALTTYMTLVARRALKGLKNLPKGL